METKNITLVSLVFVFIIFGGILIFLKINGASLDENELRQFSSLQELNAFLERAEHGYIFGGVSSSLDSFAASSESSIKAQTSSVSARDYSQTNIQVKGVDEPDIVKNDGKYIYIVSKKKVLIVDAYPAEEMKILSEIEFENHVNNIFISEDSLVVFFRYTGKDSNQLYIYNIYDRESPELLYEYEFDGYYIDSRMVDNYIYTISNKYVSFFGDERVTLPRYSFNGLEKEMELSEIYYFPSYDYAYTFNIISAININTGEFEKKVYLLGASHNIYVSENNIYLTQTKYPDPNDYFKDLIDKILPLLPSAERKKCLDIIEKNDSEFKNYMEVFNIVEEYSMSLKGSEKQEFDKNFMKVLEEFELEFQKRSEKTVIHKIGFDKLDIEYKVSGEVPGRILNQFSMDESSKDETFRIATTTGNSWRDTSLNHLYVLDNELEIIGSVEDLAKGEIIYSARFIGERAYMVTFKQIDPLFVIDLSNPKNPKVLGELKITGYSSYLHPYDENHLIGVGMEATEEGRITGVKISLFDVSDVHNPIEKAKYEIDEGGWGYSEALYDHKAFLFDKGRSLLVIPVSYTIEEPSPPSLKEEDGVVSSEIEVGIDRRFSYNYWSGVYVFDIDLNEINLKGKIIHENPEKTDYLSLFNIRRSLYMDDVLYTISDRMIKANDLLDLEFLKQLHFPYEEVYSWPYRLEGGGFS